MTYQLRLLYVQRVRFGDSPHVDLELIITLDLHGLVYALIREHATIQMLFTMQYIRVNSKSTHANGV